MTTPANENFGPTLRRLRKLRRMSQHELASAAGTHVTHLSRLEGAQRTEVSRDLLERLGDTLGASAQLAAAAGRLTSRAERAISPFADAFDDDLLLRHTLPVLRRISAGSRASRLIVRTPGGAVKGGRIDPGAICRMLGFTLVVSPTTTGPPVEFRGRTIIVSDPGEPGDPVALPRTRFLAAHAAAHIDAQVSLDEMDKERTHRTRAQADSSPPDYPTCTYPRMQAGEEVLCDIAAHLLSPSSLLEPAFQEALREVTEAVGMASERGVGVPSNIADTPWRPDAGRLITAVAAKLAIPGWVAVRRLADEALLDEEALYYRHGDRP